MAAIEWLSASDAAERARPGARIYVAGCCGEPTAILDAVAREPALWRDVRLTGAYIPGVNKRDLSAIGTATSVTSIFATEGLRPARSALTILDDHADSLPPVGRVREGVPTVTDGQRTPWRTVEATVSTPSPTPPHKGAGLSGRASPGTVSLWPAHYSEFWRFLATPGNCDIGYFQVSPPRADGTVGFGIAADFSPAVEQSGARLIGIVNRSMPDVPDGPRLPLARFDALVESDTPLIAYDPGPADPVIDRIGALIAERIRDGDTIQLGLGKVQGAVLRALAGSRGLGFHAGMIADDLLPLIEAGTFSRGVTTGVALGSPGLYAKLGALPGIRFRPVGETHAIQTLASISNLVSVNSVIDVDLTGQANAEMLKSRQVSGHGGMVDFIRGARLSSGGRSILALPATANGGTGSRIVAALPPGTPVSVARSDIDQVATEYGVAELREASLDERARRLIAIAAPKFRDELSEAFARLSAGGATR